MDERDHLQFLVKLYGKHGPDIATHRQLLAAKLDLFENTQDSSEKLLHLAQAFLHQAHPQLQLKLWVLTPRDAYLWTLTMDDVPMALHMVLKNMLDKTNPENPGEPRRFPDHRRWHVCQYIAADWTRFIKANISNQDPIVFNDDHVYFDVNFSMVSNVSDESVVLHLVAAMCRCFHGFHVQQKHTYFALMASMYKHHSDYEYTLTHGTVLETL